MSVDGFCMSGSQKKNIGKVAKFFKWRIFYSVTALSAAPTSLKERWNRGKRLAF